MTLTELAQQIDKLNEEVAKLGDHAHEAKEEYEALKREHAVALEDKANMVLARQDVWQEAVTRRQAVYDELKALISAGVSTPSGPSDPSTAELKKIALEGQKLRKK